MVVGWCWLLVIAGCGLLVMICCCCFFRSYCRRGRPCCGVGVIVVAVVGDADIVVVVASAVYVFSLGVVVAAVWLVTLLFCCRFCC